MLRKFLTASFCVAVLFSQTGSALAVARSSKAGTTIKKKVVTNLTVEGPKVKCHQWGFLKLELKVTKTVATVKGKPSVTIKINSVSWPVFPNHTTRSIYINQQALPLLQQETMQLQANAATKLVNIAGATHTTVSWRQSLQAALVQAEKP